MKLEQLLQDALERLEWPRLMEHVSKNACFDETKTYFQCLKPWFDEKERDLWVLWVQQLNQALESGLDVHLHHVSFGGAINRIRIGSFVNLSQLQDVLSIISMSKSLKHFLEEAKKPELNECFGDIPSSLTLANRLEFCLDGKGLLLDRASPELKSLRSKVLSLEYSMTKELDSLINTSHVKDKLQDHLWMRRDGHFVLPIKVAYKNEIKGTAKGLSSSGATVFIEPASLHSIQNNLDEARNQLNIEETRIINDLSLLAHQHFSDINMIYHLILKLDKVFTRAKFSKLINGSWPCFHSHLDVKPRFYFKNAQHPLYVLECQNCIENTMELSDKGKVWVLSGPNAGGKTVVMKTVGLLTLMSKAAFSITAQEGILFNSPFVFADLGDRQSRIENLSTFSGHLQHISSILKYAVQGSLVLLDECFVGTDPEMGLALARSTLEYLEQLGVTVVITTHFEGLKKMCEISSSFINASMEFSSKSLSPTYRLLDGIPGKSYAFELATRIGFPKLLIENAAGYYGVQNAHLDKLVSELNRKSELLKEKINLLEKEKNLYENLNNDLQSKVCDVDLEKKNLFDTWNTKIDKRLRAFNFILQNSLEEKDPEEYLKNHLNANDIIESEEILINPISLKVSQKQLSKKTPNKSLKEFNELSTLLDKLPSNTDLPTNDTKILPKLSLKKANNIRDLVQENAKKLKTRLEEEKGNVNSSVLKKTIENLKPIIPSDMNVSVGDKVYAKGFTVQGLVISKADSKGQVTCEFNGIKVKVSLHNLKSSHGNQLDQIKKTKQSQMFSSTPVTPVHVEDHDWHRSKIVSAVASCDLRGMTAEDAENNLELFLDKKYLLNDKFLFIIHGYGSGIVKSAVREYLKKSPYIKRYRPGLFDEGGDGVTVVEMGS